MEKDDYRKLIVAIVNQNKSMEWLIAVYSFAKNYPDTGKKEE